MADSTYQTLLKIAVEVENAPDIEGARAAVGRLINEAKQADEAGAAFKALGVDIAQLRTGMTASEQSIVNALRTIASNAETTGTELKASVVAALQQVKSPAALQQIQNDLKELAIQGRNTTGPMQLLGGTTMDLREKADGGAVSVRNLGRGMQDTAGLASMLKEAVAGIGLAYLAKEAMDATDGMTRIEKGFEAVTGSSQAAGKELDFVRGIAAQLGANLSDTANSYLSLEAASKGTALEGQRTRDIFAAVAGAMATLGKSSDDTQGALQALAQMISKGTVQAEELKGQLGERLPGAFQLAARAMGVSTAQLQKMLESGQVLAEDLLPKLAAQLDKTYGEGAKKVETFGAAFQRMWNDIKEATATTASGGVQTFFTGLIEGAGKAVLALSAIPTAVSETVKATAEVAAAANTGGSTLDALKDAADRAGNKFWDLGLKILNVKDPVAETAADLERLKNSIEDTRTPLQRLQEAAKGNLQALPSDLKAIIESLRATGDASTAAETAFAKFAAAPEKLSKPDTVLQLAEVIQLIGQNAKGAGEAIDQQLGKSLEKLSSQQLANLGAEAQRALDTLANNENARQAVIGLGTVIDSVAVEALRRLNIDGQAALTGIDAKTKDALASLEILGKSAVVSAQTMREAFANLVNSANTQQELDQLQAKLQQLGKDGKLSADDVALGLAQIETKAATVQSSLDPVQQALNRIGVDGREAITGVDAKFQGMIVTLQALAKDAAVSGEALYQAVNKAADAASTKKEIDLLAEAVKAMGKDGRLSGDQVAEALAKIAVEAGRIVESTDAAALALKTLGVTGHRELQAIADQAVLAFDTLKKSGEASTGDLNVAFESMAEKVLKAAQAMGPLAEDTAAWKLKAMTATEEQQKALDDLIAKYADSGTAAEQAAGKQVSAANTAAAAIEDYAARVEARAGAGALAFQNTTDAINNQTSAVNTLNTSQTRLIDGYNELTAAGKAQAEQELKNAAAADNRLAGMITYRDETGKTIREMSNLIAAEKQEAEQVARLKDAYEQGNISAASLKYQLAQLALELQNPLTNAGNNARNTIRSLLTEVYNLGNSSNITANNLNSLPSSIGRVNTSLSSQTTAIRQATSAMQQLHSTASNTVEVLSGLGNLDISKLKQDVISLAGDLGMLNNSALQTGNSLTSLSKIKLA